MNAPQRAEVFGLSTLPAKQALERIKDMLMKGSSESVRKQLIAQKVRILRWFSEDFEVTLDDVLNYPFFTIGGIKEMPDDDASTSDDLQMSGDVTNSSRKVLTDYYSYNVGFIEWASFEREISISELPKSSPEGAGADTWAQFLVSFLSTTFSQHLGEPGEIQELMLLSQGFLNLPVSFGFKIIVKNGRAHDFSFSDLHGARFLFGEGKESSCLPRLCQEGGHKLCLFGFATNVARTMPGPGYSVAGLVGELGIKDIADKKVTSCEASPMVKSLLMLEGGIKEVACEVRCGLKEKRLETHDAVNLWAAVMQACHYTVKNRKQISIVLSARMIWYIRLRVDADDVGGAKCYVEISKASKVGASHCSRTLVSLLALASRTPQMDLSSHRMWQRALSGEVEDDEGNQRKEPDSRQQRPHGKKRKRDDTKKSPDRGQTMNHSAQGEVVSNALGRVVSSDESDYQFKDKYGVVPYFDQIGDSLELLGRGRSGVVTRVQWNGEDVALKTFENHPRSEDERYFYDIYEYELEVLFALRDLWGLHVPALLFHKPWRTSPMIGLQLGQQIMEDDMSEWPEEDRQKADETITKVKELGWTQKDLRGSNFLRLTGPDGSERIAMIDFESMVNIK